METPETEGPAFEPIINFHTGPSPRGDGIAQAIASATELLKPDVISIQAPDGTEAVAYVDADGVHLMADSDFDQFRTDPATRKGTARMLTLASFIEHVNRFSNENTVIFADDNRAAPKLTAVLDYHDKGAEGQARFGHHKTSHAFPLSDEWKLWSAANGTKFKMAEFARFLEDNVINVVPVGMVSMSDGMQLQVDNLGGVGKIADPAKLRDLSLNLEIYEESHFKQAQRLSSGEHQIEFSAEHVDGKGGKLNLPEMFVLGIPVFKGGEPYQVLARLRYRKDGAGVVFWYDLMRTDLVFDHAFDEALDRVRNETDKPVLIGHPEA